MINKTWTVAVEVDDETGDYVLPLPPEVLELQGWKTGDVLNWGDNMDGSFTLTKTSDTELVLVEAIQSYRMRYLVEVPKGKSEWAADTVTMMEAKEFSQLSLGEQITSYRVVTEDEAIEISDADTDYLKSWTREEKLSAFVTTWKEQNDPKTTVDSWSGT